MDIKGLTYLKPQRSLASGDAERGRCQNLALLALLVYVSQGGLGEGQRQGSIGKWYQLEWHQVEPVLATNTATLPPPSTSIPHPHLVVGHQRVDGIREQAVATGWQERHGGGEGDQRTFRPRVQGQEGVMGDPSP